MDSIKSVFVSSQMQGLCWNFVGDAWILCFWGLPKASQPFRLFRELRKCIGCVPINFRTLWINSVQKRLAYIPLSGLQGCNGAGTHGNGVPIPYSCFALKWVRNCFKMSSFFGCVPTPFGQRYISGPTTQLTLFGVNFMHKIELMADPEYPGSNILTLLVALEYFSTLFKLLH